MTEQEKADLLAEHVVKMRRFGPYWEREDGYRVLRGDRAENGWHPFANIAQAKEVLDAMLARFEWSAVAISSEVTEGVFGWHMYQVCFRSRDDWSSVPTMYAIADSLSTAICEAAGSVLKLWRGGE